MDSIKRFMLNLRTANGGDLLPLHDVNQQLGELYPDKEAATQKLVELCAELNRYCTDVHFDEEEGCFSLTCLGIPIIGEVKEINIYLSSHEEYLVGDSYLHSCKVEDCRNAIYGFAGYDPDDDEESADNLSANQSFMDKYGVSVCDLAEGASVEISELREKIVERFDKIFDANLDPNSLWEEAVRYVLAAQKV